MNLERQILVYLESMTEPQTYRQIAEGVKGALEYTAWLTRGLEADGQIEGYTESESRLRRFSAVGEE